MTKAPRIIREFHVERRHDFIMVYPFTTYVTVFDSTPAPNLSKINKYFRKLLRHGCPEKGDKKSVSKGKVLMIEKEEVNSELCQYANDANYHGAGTEQHEVVQDYMHKEDILTYASEIPVWNDEHHGHIDLIRYLPNDRIEIVDFKPKANKETKAATQVYRYIMLLCERTQISLNDVEGYYFDDAYCYKLIL